MNFDRPILTDGIVALIYTHVKNLWQYVPIGRRVVLWAAIAVDIAVTLWNQIPQPLNN